MAAGRCINQLCRLFSLLDQRGLEVSGFFHLSLERFQLAFQEPDLSATFIQHSGSRREERLREQEATLRRPQGGSEDARGWCEEEAGSKEVRGNARDPPFERVYRLVVSSLHLHHERQCIGV